MKCRLAVFLTLGLFACLPLLAIPPDQVNTYDIDSHRTLNITRTYLTIYSGDTTQLQLPFTELQLAILDLKELRLLRNAIFAQYGYIFQSHDLSNWFSQFDWYRPDRTDVTGELTDIDKWHIETILLYELKTRLDELDRDINPESMIGVWQDSYMIAAGFGTIMRFMEDGTFSYHLSEMNFAKRLIKLTGRWKVLGSLLLVTVKEMTISLGGYIIEPFGATGSGFAIHDPIIGTFLLNEPLSFRFPVGKSEEVDLTGAVHAEFDKLERRFIGSWQFWKLYSDPHTGE